MFKKSKARKLFITNLTIYGLLKQAHDVGAARSYLMGYLGEMSRQLHREVHRVLSMEWSIQISCLRNFRKIISSRSERLAKYSIVKLLLNLAHENYDELPETLNDGFFEELLHLLEGLRGNSGIYENAYYPAYIDLHGKEASQLRSDDLDQVAEHCLNSIKRYPHGLDPSIQSIREKNKKRILEVFKASENEWQDYRWHVRNVIRDSAQLEALVQLNEEEKKAIDMAVAAGIPFGITPYYVSLMDQSPHRRRDHAVRAQVIPPMSYVEVMTAHRGDPACSFDFMLEHDTSPIELITRRYPTIIILKPYNTCSQICVYCQRNWEINQVLEKNALASQKKMEAAYQWIEDHPAIEEVLVTGGDPLVLSDKRIDNILARLAGMKQIERIRIGTRTPVVLPFRFTPELLEVITKYHEPGKREMTVVTHFEHPYEITPQAMQAVQAFRTRGISVYNQAVFTIENSRRFELATLRKILRMIGVDNYYTFNTKGKEETRAYRVPMARLQQEIKEEARLLPGMVRTDEPVYNVPGLGKNYLRAQQHHSILTILPDGRRVYEFHPWEKNLRMAKPFVDVDVSIFDYLEELKRRGEDPEAYKSIWYYY